MGEAMRRMKERQAKARAEAMERSDEEKESMLDIFIWWAGIYNPLFMWVPFAIGWKNERSDWRLAYVFGIRVAMWRVR